MPTTMDTGSQALTGPQKAALIVVTLGTETAAKIFRWLSNEEIEQLVAEVANLSQVPANSRDKVLREFVQTALAQGYAAEGGMDVARKILDEAMGADRSSDIIDRMYATSRGDVFHMNMLGQVAPRQLVTFIQGEHPQTIALILVQLKPKHAARVLAQLPAEVQPGVIARMATMEKISPEMIKEIEGVLEQHLAGMVRSTRRRMGGVQMVADLLNQVERTAEKSILSVLGEDDPELADQIRNLMFVFEDLLQLGDRDIQRVLKDVDSQDLAMALKLASDELKEKIFQNLSKRAAEALNDEIEFLGPLPLKTVEDSQRRIVEAVRRLDESGEVHISRGEGEQIVE